MYKRAKRDLGGIQYAGGNSEGGGSRYQLINIGASNLVAGSTNTYSLTLNTYLNFGSHWSVALAQGQQFFSWNNIGPEFVNQTLSLTWIDGVTTQFVIPSGQYTIDDLSGYIQFICRGLGWYLVNDSAQNVYYYSLSANAVYNKILFTSTVLPATLPAGWSYGTGTGAAWTTNLHTPQMTILPSPQTFTSIIGFTPGTYPPTTPAVYATGTVVQALLVVTGTGTVFTSSMVGGTLTYADLTTVLITGFTDATHITVGTSQTKTSQAFSITYSALNSTYSVLGASVPTLSPVSSVSVNCNLVNNPNTAQNFQSIYQFNANGISQRGSITYPIPEYIWLPIITTQVQVITIYLTDQLSRPLVQTDTNANWLLYLRNDDAV